MHSQFVDLDELEDDLEVLQNFNFPVKIFWWPVDQLIQTFDRKMQFWKSGQKFSKEKWRWRCSRKLHFPAKRKCSGGGRRNLEKWTFDQKILTGKLILIFGQKFSEEKFNSSYTSFPPQNPKLLLSTWFHFLRKFWPGIQFLIFGQKFSDEKFNSSYTSFPPQNPKWVYQVDFTSSENFDRKINFGKLGRNSLRKSSILPRVISAAKSKICKFQNFIIPSSLHFQFILHTFLFHLDHFQPHFVSTTTFQKSTHHAFSP